MSGGGDPVRRFLGRPPAWRVVTLLALGILACGSVLVGIRLSRPSELPGKDSAEGLRRAVEVVSAVGKSDFGLTARGKLLSAAAAGMIEQGRVRFSPDLQEEALYRKEPLRNPVLYISAPSAHGRVLWPSRRELAERIFHESLHVVVGASEKCVEEECDAFCAAEEAAAAVENRLPCYPVMRDGKTVWKWVREAYLTHRTDPAYRPVGCTIEDLAARTGVERLPVVRPAQR